MGYAQEDKEQITIYTYPELFINRISGKPYTHFAGISAYKKWKHGSGKYYTIMGSATLGVDAPRNEINFGYSHGNKLHRGMYVKGAFDNDETAMVIAVKTSGSSEWKETTEPQDDVVAVKVSKNVSDLFAGVSVVTKVNLLSVIASAFGADVLDPRNIYPRASSDWRPQRASRQDLQCAHHAGRSKDSSRGQRCRGRRRRG